MQTCCGCCGVRVGSLVIGTLGWIGNLCNLLFLISGLVQAKDAHDPANRISTEFIQGLFITSIVITSVSLLFNILLVVGVQKKMISLMLPWIIFSFIGTFLFTVVVVIRFFYSFFARGHVGEMLFESLIMMLLCILAWYCCLCVFSHYSELRDGQTIETSGEVELAHGIDNATTDYKASAPPI